MRPDAKIRFAKMYGNETDHFRLLLRIHTYTHIYIYIARDYHRISLVFPRRIRNVTRSRCRSDKFMKRIPANEVSEGRRDRSKREANSDHIDNRRRDRRDRATRTTINYDDCYRGGESESVIIERYDYNYKNAYRVIALIRDRIAEITRTEKIGKISCEKSPNEKNSDSRPRAAGRWKPKITRVTRSPTRRCARNHIIFGIRRASRRIRDLARRFNASA